MNVSAINSLFCCAAAALMMAIAPKARAQEVVPIWTGVAPGSETWQQKEVEYTDGGGWKMVRNIVQPTLTVFLPEKSKANGTAVVICPGGGFRFLSWDSEGVLVAKWLRDRGVAAFVLKYRTMDTGATQADFDRALQELFHPSGKADAARLPDSIPILAMADGRQAMKVVRQRAAEWGVAPDRIGILGFSAGGVVAMGDVMQHDAESKPNFAAPIYGAVTGGLPIPSDAPPLFILCANDDDSNAIASAKTFSDWKAAGKSVELHIYSKGGHGFGMHKQGKPVDSWIDRFADWLDVQGLLKARVLAARIW